MCIRDRCDVLNKMGAQIEGIGTTTLTIHGVKELRPVNVTTIPDMIEAGTFLMAGALMGRITLNKVDPSHLSIVTQQLEQAGGTLGIHDDSITIEKCNELQAVDITTDVHPGFPTDLQAQMMALMSLANGNSQIKENIFENRFMHVAELNRMGAKIKIKGNNAIIEGNTKFEGAELMATDLRASVSLILAALTSKNKSIINRIYHLDRGYEQIEKKLKKIGAKIKRLA